MNPTIPTYPAVKREDPVARSMAKPDACAKPATLGSKVRIRVTQGDKSLKRSRKKRRNDPRDVTFY